jgi:hypothetical protein
MKKKVAAVVIMGIVGIVGLYAVGDTGVKHTIKTKQGEIEKSVSLRIRSEGVRRVVSISKEKAEKIKIGFKADTGKLYLRTGESWEEDKSIGPYYNYVKGLNSYVETAGEITEIEDVGYYEGEIKSRGLFKGKEEAEIELRDEDGIHIIILEKEGTAKVISFRDKYRIGETTEAEIEALRGSKTMPTMLPGCSFFLGIPYGNAKGYIEAGLPVALASDYNPGSSPSGDMRFVMALGCIRMRLTPEQAFNACTINTAYAMGVSDSLGSITKGKKANLIITKPIPSLAFIPYSHQTPFIKRVILNGK